MSALDALPAGVLLAHVSRYLSKHSTAVCACWHLRMAAFVLACARSRTYLHRVFISYHRLRLILYVGVGSYCLVLLRTTGTEAMSYFSTEELRTEDTSALYPRTHPSARTHFSHLRHRALPEAKWLIDNLNGKTPQGREAQDETRVGTGQAGT